MPLIIITGYPSSGKTTRATQLHAYLQSKLTSTTSPRRNLKLHLISPHTLQIPRTSYSTAPLEKTARATEYSAIKRVLSKDDVVIADGLNYIKGYRYQLFCEAKALLTPSCVVHVAAPAEKCREWNAAREEEVERWEGETLENLVFRYEEPNGNARWDSPLFTVPWMDSGEECMAVWEQVWKAVCAEGVVVKANQATVLKPASESDYLYELDKTTQEVVSLVLDHQKNSGGGGELPVPECGKVLELPGQDLTVAQLQRIRRQFIALNRQHSVGKQRIRELFVEYFNGNFRD
ncbi:chromatin associated protein KTI12 [Choiromyces venosus 120613-1]|uniref:Chromatin associated protein KTI12 n=1 Tax=Choiromyces venosus 120613-1 TaxID=1336337 RepID=A0A3N4J9A5_9PEZI|nr:chromatin associated protein KTI12 [Choiromyces venosus 120613-1]